MRVLTEQALNRKVDGLVTESMNEGWLGTLLKLGLAGAGGWWAWNKYKDWKNGGRDNDNPGGQGDPGDIEDVVGGYDRDNDPRDDEAARGGYSPASPAPGAPTGTMPSAAPRTPNDERILAMMMRRLPPEQRMWLAYWMYMNGSSLYAPGHNMGGAAHAPAPRHTPSRPGGYTPGHRFNA